MVILLCAIAASIAALIIAIAHGTYTLLAACEIAENRSQGEL